MPVRSVLVVDDNPLVRQAVCELFTREGDFDVCGEAENGREAIEKAQLLRPNLIVTDLAMPVMNGLEETRVLKKLMHAVHGSQRSFCSKKSSRGWGIRRCLQI
jgi:two-component system, chemotaxis family, protein-glutamate methylesterase/glutaminase